jgi:alanine dehydrogenase
LKRGIAFDADSAKAGVFASRMSDVLPFESASSLRDATLAADVIVTCTTARKPFLDTSDVPPGAFIAAVGADNEEKQELDPRMVAASKVVVDSLDQCAIIGDLKLALKQGLMTKAGVHAELGDVIAGRKPGRENGEEVIVFDSTGTALQDVAAAAIVYERAVATDRGVVLDFAE